MAAEMTAEIAAYVPENSAVEIDNFENRRRTKMPIVTVKLAKGRSVEQKRALAKAVTGAVVATLDVRPEWVTVLIEEFDRENWATAGELHADRFGPGCGKEHSGK